MQRQIHADMCSRGDVDDLSQGSASGIPRRPLQREPDVPIGQAAHHHITGYPNAVVFHVQLARAIAELEFTDACFASEWRTTFDNNSRTTPNTIGSTAFLHG